MNHCRLNIRVFFMNHASIHYIYCNKFTVMQIKLVVVDTVAFRSLLSPYFSALTERLSAQFKYNVSTS